MGSKFVSQVDKSQPYSFRPVVPLGRISQRDDGALVLVPHTQASCDAIAPLFFFIRRLRFFLVTRFLSWRVCAMPLPKEPNSDGFIDIDFFIVLFLSSRTIFPIPITADFY